MWQRFHLWLWIVVVLGFAAFYWLMRDNRSSPTQARPIAIGELRALAAQLPGPAPSRIDAELVGTRQVAGDLIAAGSGLRRALIGTMAYRLEVPGSGPIVIDSGIRRVPARALGIATHIPRAQERLEAALRRATLVILTGARAEHSGGVRALLRQSGALPPLALDQAQRWRLARSGARLPAATITSAAARAVAPGVVVVPTPDIGAGAQMIFVRLENGREYLFTGDAAMLDVNWRELRAHARFAALRGGVPARGDAYAWLRTISALKQQAPKMLVVPGHDITFLRNAEVQRPRLNLSFPPEPAVSHRDGGATT